MDELRGKIIQPSKTDVEEENGEVFSHSLAPNHKIREQPEQNQEYHKDDDDYDDNYDNNNDDNESDSEGEEGSSSNIPNEADGDEEEGSESSEITALSVAFRNLMDKIYSRVSYLAQVTNKSVSNTYKSIESEQIAHVDRQISQLEEVIAQCDGLESELLKIRQIGEIASAFKERIRLIEKRLNS